MRIHVQTAIGVTCATLPTSSSACIMRLIRATGNLVLTSIPAPGRVSGASSRIGATDMVTDSGIGASSGCKRDERWAISSKLG